MRDTIFALSSGHPPTGVAIIRISGPGVRFGLETLVGRIPAPRVAALSDIRDYHGALLDRGIVLYFPAPNSFTGEEVAELQIHGSRASIAAVLSALSELEEFRLAESGEFTRRAFENGRVDLTEVEGLSDLIRAETDAQRKQALGQADGALRTLYEGWARRLTHARAMIEAELDFSDEDDIPGSVSDRIWLDLRALAGEIAAHLAKARVGEIVRDGFRIALIGPPNVGKSSLLNALARRDVAIVSDMPGTTRDVIETRLDVGGYLVLLQDTAGLRETENEVEVEGMRRSLETAKAADLVLVLRELVSGSAKPAGIGSPETETLVVWTKADLAGGDIDWSSEGDAVISNKTGAGLDDLLDKISARLKMLPLSGDERVPSRDRHVRLLKDCLRDLEMATSEDHAPVEVRSEYLRSAASALGRITGTVDVEDLLGVIFSEFCVGK